jgi:hypothetical protein
MDAQKQAEKYLRSEENFCTVKNIFSYGRKEIFVRSQQNFRTVKKIFRTVGEKNGLLCAIFY